MYDLIGDIHGHAEPLERLLSRLGYRCQDGTWRHPSRQVIFLGDFIDRGPQQVEVVTIARRMVEAGQALAVMGNHEFNAVAWATPDPERPGQCLRPHSEKNRAQHRAFLAQVGEGSALHAEFIAWFRQLPLYLDLPELRVVHACWHPASLAVLDGCTDAARRILPEAWPRLCAPGTAPFEALETVLKGLEIALPAGSEFTDKDGHLRRHVRTQWWDTEGLTYRELALVPAEVIEAIPHVPIPADVQPGYDGEKPLFIGHYWLTGRPFPLSPHIACLDYSIAGRDRRQAKLCAYRWNHERQLVGDHFVWVEADA